MVRLTAFVGEPRYMFVGFHIICDDFFVPSLNVLCEKLNMPVSQRPPSMLLLCVLGGGL